MARRSNRRSATRGDASRRTPSFGAHWRADGAPKTAYRTQSEALAMADERRRDSGADLNVYRCDFCSAWHMGNVGGRRDE
jgi:hypothetical protein